LSGIASDVSSLSATHGEDDVVPSDVMDASNENRTKIAVDDGGRVPQRKRLQIGRACL
jgi:hypothetical protein